MQMMVERGQATASNVEGSDRWQIIDLERYRSTTELAWNLKFSQKKPNLAFDV